MQFSEDTLTILRNFSTINKSLLLREGNTLRTLSPHKTMMATATISEDVPANAAIFDLNRFLATVGMFANPEVDFKEDHFVVRQKDSRSKVKYVYAAESLLQALPEKDIELPSVDVKTTLSAEMLKNIDTAGKILQLPDVAFKVRSKILSVSVENQKEKASDNFERELEEIDCEDMTVYMSHEDLRFIPNDYEVEISKAGIILFKSTTCSYWVTAKVS